MNEKWRGYAKDVDQAHVKAQFERRFGYEPVKVVDAGTIWLAGPIGEQRQDQAADDRQAGEQLRLL